MVSESSANLSMRAFARCDLSLNCERCAFIWLMVASRAAIHSARRARVGGRVLFTGGSDLDRFVVWDYVKQRRKIIG